MRITSEGYTKAGEAITVEGNEVNSQNPEAVVDSYNQTKTALEGKVKPAVKTAKAKIKSK